MTTDGPFAQVNTPSAGFRPARVRPRAGSGAAAPGTPPPTGAAPDDTLTLLLLCCHPSLTPAAQVALTLRVVAGLGTAEIARALLLPEAVIVQRIALAKRRIGVCGAASDRPPAAELPRRVDAVLHVLCLIFNEGYTAGPGAALHRVDLTAEAVTLARRLHAALPEHPEVTGLLALMLLTDARRATRTGPDGEPVPLDEQDRSRWDRAAIAEGVDLVTGALGRGTMGPYQIRAAIAAVHDVAHHPADTDWPRILRLYDLLEVVAPGPAVTLDRVVALAMVDGPRAALDRLADAESDPALAGHHRVHAVRAHLLEMAGDHAAARIHYELAARCALNRREQRHLATRAARLARA